jgi:hypothetical protein
MTKRLSVEEVSVKIMSRLGHCNYFLDVPFNPAPVPDSVYPQPTRR